MGGSLDFVGHFGVGVAFLEGLSFCHGLILFDCLIEGAVSC